MLKKFFAINRTELFVMLVVFITAALPLFTLNCINGHDIDYHLLRIEALKTGIENGLPFLRVNMLFFGGEGYASSMFYPDFLLYIPAVLRVLGVGINLSYHIFAAVCIALNIISAFYCAKYVTGSSAASLTAMIITALYQYHIDDIYTRAAVGEFTAAIFIPFVIAGIYDLIYRNLKKPQILGIGAVGVILCHTITTGYCILLCGMALVFYVIKYVRAVRNIPKTDPNSTPEVIFDNGNVTRLYDEDSGVVRDVTPANNRAEENWVNVFVRLIFALLLVLAVTAFYWMPMLEQLLTTPFRFGESVFDLNYEKLLIKDIFKNANPGMGIAPFILLLPAIFISHKRFSRFADFCTVLGILFMLSSTGLIPWGHLQNELSFIQFPWRSFIIAGPLLAVAAGIYIDEFVKQSGSDSHKASELAILTVLAVMTVSAIGNYSRNEEGYYSYSDDYYDYARYTENVIGGEWLPMGAKDRHALSDDADFAYTSSGEKLHVRREKNTMYIDPDPNEEYIDVPFLYYKGYEAVDTDSGAGLKLEAQGENGRIRIYPDGAGHIYVYYAGTIVQHLSTLLSLAALIFLIVFFIIKKHKFTWSLCMPKAKTHGRI